MLEFEILFGEDRSFNGLGFKLDRLMKKRINNLEGFFYLKRRPIRSPERTY
jgi:hypothetical protein